MHLKSRNLTTFKKKVEPDTATKADVAAAQKQIMDAVTDHLVKARRSQAAALASAAMHNRPIHLKVKPIRDEKTGLVIEYDVKSVEN